MRAVRFALILWLLGLVTASISAQELKCHKSVQQVRHRPVVVVPPDTQDTAEALAEPDAPELEGSSTSAWSPPPQIRWQWILSLPGNHDFGKSAELYDVDMFPTRKADVTKLHAEGKKAVCYIDGGSWEKDRPDAKRFPKIVLGCPYQGYPDERWLDIRRIDILGPIMTDRIKLCKSKGFDAAQWDNLDGYYIAVTGFPLTAADQLKYNRYLADATRKQGLGVALENDIRQSQEMAQNYDWAIFEMDRNDNAKCFYGSGCHEFDPFVNANKAVMVVDYNAVKDFCTLANGDNFNGIRKHEDLGVWVKCCR